MERQAGGAGAAGMQADGLALYYGAAEAGEGAGEGAAFALHDADADLSGAAIAMDMSMELSEQQIRAFLARSEHEVNSALAAQQAGAPLESAAGAGGAHGGGEEAQRPASHSTCRDEREQQVRTHPLVAAVDADGRTVLCKCGRRVRLNPPWYILKFEQHIVSRNCTCLRQKKSKRKTLAAFQPASVSASDTTHASQTPLGNNVGFNPAPTGSTLDGSASHYALMPLQQVFQCEFPSLQFPPQSFPVDIGGKLPVYNAMIKLHEDPQFSQITPDGRIVECKCAQLIVLTSPWNLGRFLEHTKHKEVRRKRPAVGAADKAAHTAAKKTVQDTPSRQQNVLLKSISRGMSVEAAFRIRRKNFPHDFHWNTAREAGILPCPGIRDDRMILFVSKSMQLTGGSRPRQKIAQELFPHLFPTGDGAKQNSQLMDAEKLMIHDVIEGEAVWFVDKDGNTIRSMDCKGVIHQSKGETTCSNCAVLRSNTTLRAAVSATIKKVKTPRNPVNQKFCSGRVFSLLESEFDMNEEYARILRDLSLVDISDNSALNYWMDAAEMGIEGLFDSHPALIGLVDSMVTMKDKQRRGVGMQNMSYSDHLDEFMRSIAELSMEACEFFQTHLFGRKVNSASIGRKRRHVSIQVTGDEETTDDSQSDAHRETSESATHSTQLIYDTANSDGFSRLLESSNMMPNLSIGDIQDVDMTSFGTVHSAHEYERTVPSNAGDGSHHQDTSSRSVEVDSADDNSTSDSHNGGTNSQAQHAVARGSPISEETDRFLSDLSSSTSHTGQDFVGVPCTGLREEKVQRYVACAVQIIGGSRPKYVIARELFPDVFSEEEHVKIAEKLTEDQRLILQDAVFSECMWRVDKVGNCVRSLRCLRVADTRNKGVCRACRELKSISNFRSVLCRSKAPKNLENIKFVPSVFTESDPFLRKLSKNAAFRGLYQIVKVKAIGSIEKKRAAFWLKCARMGVFGHFRTHPVFEGLVESMVEIKDKERRGVGKQNMQYSKALDDFMTELSSISVEAFDLFARKFCGRTIRSQKVKRRRTQLFEQASMGSIPAQTDDGSGRPFDAPSAESIVHEHHHHQQQLLQSGELLDTSRPMMPGDLEENQRLMDRMLLDDMRLSHELQLAAVLADHHTQDKQQRDSGDSALDPRTYLDADGVLTTEI